MPNDKSGQDALYEEAINAFGGALDRLARSYEADSEKRQDLLQEIHLGLWRSFEGFDSRCSLRTWVYRVAHNVAASYVIHHHRTNSPIWLSLEELDSIPDAHDAESAADRHKAMQQLLALIQRLKPLDRQVILSYLEGVEAAAIGEITGLSAGNVATKIHRIKRLLARRFEEGGNDDK